MLNESEESLYRELLKQQRQFMDAYGQVPAQDKLVELASTTFPTEAAQLSALASRASKSLQTDANFYGALQAGNLDAVGKLFGDIERSSGLEFTRPKRT